MLLDIRIPLFAACRVNSRTIERTLNGGRGANNARKRAKMSLCFGRGWSRRGRIAPNKRDNLFSANQKCDSRRAKKPTRGNSSAKGCFRTGILENTAARGWSLPATSTRRVGQKWDTSVSENRAFATCLRSSRPWIFVKISSGCISFARWGGVNGTTVDGSPYPVPLFFTI